eukprot:6212810-Pleurochrysis_carterae.AAC.1
MAHTLNRSFCYAGIKSLGRAGFCGSQDAGVNNITGYSAGALSILGSRSVQKIVALIKSAAQSGCLGIAEKMKTFDSWAAKPSELQGWDHTAWLQLIFPHLKA